MKNLKHFKTCNTKSTNINACKNTIEIKPTTNPQKLKMKIKTEKH